MPSRFQKGCLVMFRAHPATVEKTVGGDDYVIRMAEGGKRFVVSGSRLSEYEVIEPQVETVEVPSNEPEVKSKPEPKQKPKDAPEAKPKPEPKSVSNEPKDFDSMGMKELKNLASVYGVKGRSKMKIEELRSAVRDLFQAGRS